MEDITIVMPAIALRGMSIMPGMIAHFDISRDRSLKAVEESMQADQKIFLVTQRDVDVEEPMQFDLYEMGLPLSLTPFSTIWMASTGQTLAHFLHPIHLLSVSSGLSRSK